MWTARLEHGTTVLFVGGFVAHKVAGEAIDAAETNKGTPLLAMASEEGPRFASAGAVSRSLADVAVISAKPC